MSTACAVGEAVLLAEHGLTLLDRRTGVRTQLPGPKPIAPPVVANAGYPSAPAGPFSLSKLFVSHSMVAGRAGADLHVWSWPTCGYLGCLPGGTCLAEPCTGKDLVCIAQGKHCLVPGAPLPVKEKVKHEAKKEKQKTKACNAKAAKSRSCGRGGSGGGR